MGMVLMVVNAAQDTLVVAYLVRGQNVDEVEVSRPLSLRNGRKYGRGTGRISVRTLAGRRLEQSLESPASFLLRLLGGPRPCLYRSCS